MVLEPTPHHKHLSHVIAKVGVIGCGNISNIYLHNLQRAMSLQVTAVSDVDMRRAKTQAERYGTRALPISDLLVSDVDIIVNLTSPYLLPSINEQIINAGKSLYSGQPPALCHADAQRLLKHAAAQGVLVGCAPDTFLGAGLQTCRRIIDAGLIGEPRAASAYMLGSNQKNDHPDSRLYDQPAGGLLFTTGFSYLTALVYLLGSIKSVSGTVRTSRVQQKCCDSPKGWKRVAVKTPTHIVGLLEFANGLRASLTTSGEMTALPFDNACSNIAIYGSDATLCVPDPNTFAGAVQLKTRHGDWQNIPLNAGYTENSCGVGVADMAWALHEKRQQRASGELAGHVLEAMEKILLAAQEKRWLTLESHTIQPEPLTNPTETWFHLSC